MRQGKLAVATAFGQDVADVEEYQPGRHRPKLWQVGDDIVRTAKPEETVDGFEPHPAAEWFCHMYGIKILRRK